MPSKASLLQTAHSFQLIIHRLFTGVLKFPDLESNRNTMEIWTSTLFHHLKKLLSSWKYRRNCVVLVVLALLCVFPVIWLVFVEDVLGSAAPAETPRQGVEFRRDLQQVWDERAQKCTGEGSRPAWILRVHVITMNRSGSLQRLLESLQHAEYFCDRVDLYIFIDKIPDTLFGLKKSPYSHDPDTVNVAESISWQFGEKTVILHTENKGLYWQWVDSWAPMDPSGQMDSGIVEDPASRIDAEPNSYTLLLEDDLEVSPLFWAYLKQAIERYDNMPKIAGYTLQFGTLRANQTRSKSPISFDPNTDPIFFYKLLGSWGYMPKRETWIEFRKWFHQKEPDMSFDPTVKGLLPSFWFKRQFGRQRKSMWTMWFIRFCHDHGYFTVYANFRTKTGTPRTFASNWKERGMHYGRSSSSPDFLTLQRNESAFIKYIPEPRYYDWDGSLIQMP